MSSTPRFALLWLLVTVPTIALLSPVHNIYSAKTGMTAVGCFPAVFLSRFVFDVLAASAAAFGQEWLLTWHRRPVRRWWAWMTAGAAAAWLANYGVLSQIFRWIEIRGSAEVWVAAISTSASSGVAFGSAAALSLWGKSWPQVWLRWMSGVLVIFLAQAVAQGVLYLIVGDPRFTDSPLTWSIVLRGMDATIVAAGTVLWMEKLILRPDVTNLSA